MPGVRAHAVALRHADLLLLDATIVTMDRDRRIIEGGAVAVLGQRIAAVGRTEEILAGYAGARRIDCRGRVLIPGLIDIHGHAGHSLFKTVACDTPSHWMRVMTTAYNHYTTPDFWYADGLVAAAERLRAGVTCGVSILGGIPRSDDPAFGVNHARGYGEVGVREILCVGPSGLPWPNPVTRWTGGAPARHLVGFDEMIAGAEAIIESCNQTAEGRITTFLTPFTIVPSVDPSNPTAPDRATRLTAEDRLQARRIRETAAKWGVRLHSDAFGGMVRMAVQDKENALLGPDIHLQHCVGLALDEVEILAETGTHVSHSPGGQAPVIAMLTRGVNVAVATDGTSPRRPFDLIQAARQVQFAHQLQHNDRYLLPPGRLLEMITIDAARAVGLDREIGSLEAGKKADIAIVNMRQPHLTPNWMPVHRLMYEATGHDIETVIVDGRVIMEERRILTLDIDRALDFAEAEGRALIARAGIAAHLTDPGWRQTRRGFDAPIVLPDPP